MKNSSGFSYTLSLVFFVALLALLAGYFAGLRKGKNATKEGFADAAKEEGFASGTCNVCNMPKPSCGCRQSCPVKCPVCNKCESSCGCPQSVATSKKTISSVDAVTGPSRMNRARLGRRPSVSPPSGAPEKCPPAPPCPVPDPTKYVLKSTIPPCPPMPDMSRYMLKTECPSQPDMSKYVLKSSVPKCPPCISSCSKPCKIGECPPCPRPRCPTVNCPEPKPCPACPPVQVQACPEPRVQCKAQYETDAKVRPMLASTAAFGL